MACKQNNLPASMHFRPRLDCLDGRIGRISNWSLEDDIRSRHGSKFGVIGDGRYTPASELETNGKANTEGRAKAYTRFDWGIDWKGFAEVERDTADREVERTAKNGRCGQWEDESFWDFDDSDDNADVVSQAESDCKVAPSDWVPKGSDFVELEDAGDVEEEEDRIAETNADEKGIRSGSKIGVDSGDDADDERDIKVKSGSDKVKGCLSLAIHLAIEQMEEMDVGVKVK